MIALSKQTILWGSAVGLVLMGVVFLYFKYQSLHPCSILQQDFRRHAAAAGESRRVTELLWQRAEPRLDALRCLRAYAGFNPHRYVRGQAQSPQS